MKLPKQNTKLYNDIIDMGCGLVIDEYNGDHDCTHLYDWDCGDCPCVIEKNKHKDSINIDFGLK